MQTIPDRFSALGSTVEGVFRIDPVVGKELWSDVRAEILDFDARFSRFQRDSELTALHSSSGSPVHMSETMLELFDAARRMWKLTDHVVDPTVGNAMIAVGYDQSFDALKGLDDRPAATRNQAPMSFSDVVVEVERKTVSIPRDTSIDFGGIGKGFLLDRLASRIRTQTEHFWLSLGGDLVLSGTDEENAPWPISVQDPRAHNRDIVRMTPPSGTWGVATSGTTKRRGIRNGVVWHHLINPRTGRPAETDVAAATVIAPTALEADAMAKTLCILGAGDGLAWALQRPDIEALVVTANGKLTALPSTEKLLERS